jgi:hypothetical protein
VKTGPAGCSDVDSGCSQCVILLPVVATMNNSTKHTQDLEPSSNIDCFVFSANKKSRNGTQIHSTRRKNDKRNVAGDSAGAKAHERLTGGGGPRIPEWKVNWWAS